MFSLIISIIAIALVVALAGASLYYGGDAFTQGNAKAVASTYTNQAQQIQGAKVLADAEGETFVLANAVVDGYMSSVPASPGGAWVDTLGVLTAPVASLDVCDEIGIAGPLVSCSDVAIAPATGVYQATFNL